MDNAIKTLIRYEWISFARNRFQLLMIGVTFLFGLYAIYYGQSEIDAQRNVIKEIMEMEQGEFKTYQASFKREPETVEEEQNHDIASNPAFAWYRHGYHAILPPHDYAALAIGQRDLFRYYYRLTGMSLHYQLFENELANPVNLLAGNFDLSFVIVYLLPLLIIAFCYGLYSGEKENGTLPLLHIQSVTISRIVVIRLLFYFTLITGLAILMSLIGLISSGSVFKPENRLPALLWVVGVIIYTAFWFGLLFLIVSYRKSSSFNAITAAGCWLFFLIVIPSVLNIVVTTMYPLSSTTLASLTRRTGFENEDDEEETKEVIMEFLAHKPELAGSDSLIRNNRLAKAYAAFTSLKDINSQQEVDHYNEQVNKRNDWTTHFHWINPAVSMQDVFTHIVHTDLNTFLRFQDALAVFHGKITDFYFQKLFRDQPILFEDYSRLPSFQMDEDTHRYTTASGNILKISLLAILFVMAGLVQIKKKNLI
ncbi:hypothetical protein C900_05094 [Fulvivirga imtechensis AK7]|uniref:DUF3526 domain-containing protein n=1 Tax=Fulvivirga imtechensis AK7 TaxID=1237149 RepID=L8JPG3_9BACT|nr:DUF3526 domain-containing protein [Fulvivirga imtechensis]ELR69404.1 hypothetical protein C900_05094 [Fulvivirga imtechensis AK7]